MQKKQHLPLTSTNLLELVVDQVSPIVKVKTSRKGRKNVPIPIPLTLKQSRRIGIKWIIEGNMDFKSIIAGTSNLLMKRENMHKQALQNRSNLVLFDRRG
jgi:small subunit ribosomal protein S7